MKTKSHAPVAKSKRAGRKPIARKAAPRIARQSSLADELSRIQRETGADVHVITEDIWLMKCGVIVDLDIKRWRAQDTLTLQDLGLPEPKTADEKMIYAELMTLGTRKLMPPTYIKRANSLDSGARKWLTANAYKTRWGPWVDLGRYQAWRTGNLKFEHDYAALAQEIDAQWPEICKWRNEQYAIAAQRAYERLTRLAPASLKNGDGQRIALDDFRRQYVTRALLKSPTREQVVASFAYLTTLSYIPLPSMLARDVAEKERIEAARMLERTAENAILKGERGRQLCEMDDDVTASAAANSPAVVQEFVRDLQMQCVGTVLAKIESVQQGIEKQQALVGKKSEQLRNALASYQAMNLTGHPRLDDKVARLSEILGNPPSQRSLNTIVALLDEIAGIAKQTLAALKRAA